MPHRFSAYAHDEGRTHAHPVPDAADLQDAALRFAEHWGGTEHDLRVIASDRETGETRCFCIDLSAGEAAPCA